MPRGPSFIGISQPGSERMALPSRPTAGKPRSIAGNKVIGAWSTSITPACPLREKAQDSERDYQTSLREAKKADLTAWNTGIYTVVSHRSVRIRRCASSDSDRGCGIADGPHAGISEISKLSREPP